MESSPRVTPLRTEIESLYPPSPTQVPAGLTLPSRRYRLHAWLAFGGLFSFVAAYVGLSFWFFRAAYALFTGPKSGLGPFLLGSASAFLGVFLVKGLFGLTRSSLGRDLEITRAEQPRLMAFIDRVADEAGAPRPHRVFVSPRVNAAVFYDLSLLNLIFPSKKNLEIGLGLVDGLNLSEFKAVLAHEFGHFGQRSMAMGRWVYIAQQIAGNIVGKKDFLDRALRFLSGVDLRVAWIGWCLRILVWCVRALTDTFFTWVLLAQRSLSREMEFQADLVAVSLTGSDALIQALHRIGVADEAFDQALAFAVSRKRKKQIVGDIFTVQTRVLEHLGKIKDDPHYGKSPKSGASEEERVFSRAFVEAPRMWSTHPSNRDREDNTKARYVSCPLDERSSWALFDEPEKLRREVTRRLWDEIFTSSEGAELSDDELRFALLERFEIPSLDRRYQGLYLGHSPVLGVKKVRDLFHDAPLAEAELGSRLASLYPPELKTWLEELRVAEHEFHGLRLLEEGVLTAPGGVIQHRGRTLRRADLPEAKVEAQREFEEKRAIVERHNRECRSVHLSLARQAGSEWADYHESLVRLLHFLAHQSANIRDAIGHFRNTLSVVLADGNVSKGELRRLILAGIEVSHALESARPVPDPVELPAEVLARLEVESYAAVFGEALGLSEPDESNINDWIRVVDGWVNTTLDALARLEDGTLQCLLEFEDRLRLRHERGVSLDARAPAPARILKGYPTLAPGQERERQRKLDLWDRFQAADGAVATVARLLVAGGIMATLVGFTRQETESTLRVVNGLGLTVRVAIDGREETLAPHSVVSFPIARESELDVRASTLAGIPIEAFRQKVGDRDVAPVYNVAAATPLVTWFAAYGKAQLRDPILHGAPRWTLAGADYSFEKPPEQISMHGSGEVRSVYEALYAEIPEIQLSHVDEKDRARLIRVHVLWDPPGAPFASEWITAGLQRGEDLLQVLEQRLEKYPRELVARRALQQLPKMKDAACRRDRAEGAAHPEDADLTYLAARCLEGAASDEAFGAARAKFPQHPWIAWADASRLLVTQDRAGGEAALRVARGEPSLCGPASLELARILRVADGVGLSPEQTRDLTACPGMLSVILQSFEKEPAWRALDRGNLSEAVVVSTPESRAVVTVFVGASDGASEKQVEAALQLIDAPQLGRQSSWSIYALALREKKDVTALQARLASELEGEEEAFFAWLRERPWRTPGGEAPALRSHLVEFAILLACIADPEGVPPTYRERARRHWFPNERPYLRVPAPEPKKAD